jgi:hypothetical protein
MARGLTEPVEPEEPEQQGPTNEDIFKFMDQLALHVRDIETRITTLERNLFSSLNLNQDKDKPWKKGL